MTSFGKGPARSENKKGEVFQQQQQQQQQRSARRPVISIFGQTGSR